MIGRLIGKSVIDDLQFEIHFVKSFLKHMLKSKIYISDLEDIDYEECKNLEKLLEIPHIEKENFTFSYTINFFGQTQQIDLIPNGSNVQVTERNQKEYVKQMCYAKMALQIQKQTQAFLKGLEEVVPNQALLLLDEKELGLKLAGEPNINLDDLQNTAILKGGFKKSDESIVWFFQILNEYDQINRANFLFFISGTFKVPLGGFKNRQLVIVKVKTHDSLPISHTCFSQIDIGSYSSKQKMKQLFDVALNYGSQGFFIA